MQKLTDMTEGTPRSLYLRFAIPVIISDVFYQLYMLVDALVASRLIGLSAFAAISAAGFFYLFILEAVMGFSHGAGTRFAQLNGAKCFAKARNCAALSITLAGILGAVLGLLCLSISMPVLAAMNTPSEIMEDAALYLHCLFAGLAPTFLYKTLSSLFLGMGDSRTPLTALVMGAIIDTALTLILVLLTPWGIAAIGISTVVSQLAAGMYLLFSLRAHADMRLSLSDFRIQTTALSKLLRISLPISARNAVSALGGVVIQYVINGYGVAFIAGVAAAKRLYVVLFLISTAMEPAVITFIAQNYGARRLARVREGMRTANRLLLMSAVSILILMFFIGPWVLNLLIGNGPDATRVSAVAFGQLRVCLLLLPTLYLLILYRSGLQGMGKTMPTLASGVTEGGLRIAAVFILPLFFGELGIYIAEAIAWPVCAVQLFVAYSMAYRRALRHSEP